MVVSYENYVVIRNIHLAKVRSGGYIPTGDIAVLKHLIKKGYVVIFIPRILILNEKHACRLSCGDDLGVGVAAKIAGVGDLAVLLGGSNLGYSILIIMSAGDDLGIGIVASCAGIYGISVLLTGGLLLIGDCVRVLGIYVGNVAVGALGTGVSKDTGCGTGNLSCGHGHVAMTEGCDVDVIEILTAYGTLGVLCTRFFAGGLAINDPLAYGVTGLRYVVCLIAITAGAGVLGVAVGGTGGSYDAFGVFVLVRGRILAAVAAKDLPGGRSVFTVRFEVKNVAELDSIRNKLLNIRDVVGSRRGQN